VRSITAAVLRALATKLSGWADRLGKPTENGGGQTAIPPDGRESRVTPPMPILAPSNAPASERHAVPVTPPQHWLRRPLSKGPPAHWIERVRKGAPHLLEPAAPAARTTAPPTMAMDTTPTDRARSTWPPSTPLPAQGSSTRDIDVERAISGDKGSEPRWPRL